MKENRDKVTQGTDSGYRLVMVKPGVFEFVTKAEAAKREKDNGTPAEDDASQQAVHRIYF